MTATAGHVFVSHSSDNRELANELAAFLEARGIRIWIAPRDVRPGMDYSEQLQLAIESCAAFVVLVTDMANKSPYVRAETEMAFSTNKPIFPVRISDIKPAAGLAFFLKIRHWTDAYGPSRAGNLDRLTRELQALSAAATPPPAPTPPPVPTGAAPSPASTSPPPPPAPRPAEPLMTAAPTPPPPAPLTPEEEEKWRAAVGPNADYYLDRWRQMDAKNKAISWNWPACLANLFWFAYRKMWLPLAGLAVLFVVLALIGIPNATLGRITMFLSIGVTFATGAFGNHLYRKHVAKLIAASPAGTSQAGLEELRARGGVSVPALVIAIVAVLLLTALMVVAVAVSMKDQGTLDGGNNIEGSIGGFDSSTGADPSQGISGQTGDDVEGGVGGQIGDGTSGATTEEGAAAEGDKPVE